MPSPRAASHYGQFFFNDALFQPVDVVERNGFAERQNCFVALIVTKQWPLRPRGAGCRLK